MYGRTCARLAGPPEILRGALRSVTFITAPTTLRYRFIV
jgi:hypothetical protein